MDNYNEKYKEAEDILNNLNLTIGDLEEYTFHSFRKTYNIINLAASTLMLVMFLISSVNIGKIDIYLTILGPTIVYTCLSFISNLFINCGYMYISPYRESDIQNSMYALDRALKQNEKRTLKFLNSVISFKEKIKKVE